MFIKNQIVNSWRLPKRFVFVLFDVGKRCGAQMASLTENKVFTGNNKINCLQNGTGDHKVFLLPGLLGSIWSDFSPQISDFDSNKFTIIAWDPPGYGKSRPPKKDFSYGFYERDADEAVKLLKTLNIHKCSLLGWSDGGITSLIIASKYPELVDKLVVWGVNAYVTEQDFAGYQKLQNTNNWSPVILNTVMSTYGEEELKEMLNKWMDGMIEIKEKHDGDICKDFLPKIIAPTLILHGAKDPLVPQFHCEFLHQNINGSKLHVFPDGKHNIHLKFSNIFNKMVQSFLCE